MVEKISLGEGRRGSISSGASPDEEGETSEGEKFSDGICCGQIEKPCASSDKKHEVILKESLSQLEGSEEFTFRARLDEKNLLGEGKDGSALEGTGMGRGT
jgi:hypothetical protein